MHSQHKPTAGCFLSFKGATTESVAVWWHTRVGAASTALHAAGPLLSEHEHHTNAACMSACVRQKKFWRMQQPVSTACGAEHHYGPKKHLHLRCIQCPAWASPARCCPLVQEAMAGEGHLLHSKLTIRISSTLKLMS